MNTVSGIEIEPGGTTAPSLYDIGYSLSQMPRFAGHTKKPWVVLQHLYASGKLARKLYPDTRMELLMLLHDAHECVTGDLPRPWKPREVKVFQYQLDTRIYFSLGLDLPNGDEYDRISHVDELMLTAEQAVLGPPGNHRYIDHAKPYPYAVELVEFYQPAMVLRHPKVGGRLYKEYVESLLVLEGLDLEETNYR